MALNKIKFIQEKKKNVITNHEEFLKGNEIKRFYEEMISDSNHLYKDVGLNVRSKVRFPAKNSKSNKKHLNTSKFLNYCQNGHLNELVNELMLNSNQHIQYLMRHKDSYGWTGYMCAAQSNHLNIMVKLIELDLQTNQLFKKTEEYSSFIEYFFSLNIDYSGKKIVEICQESQSIDTLYFLKQMISNPESISLININRICYSSPSDINNNPCCSISEQSVSNNSSLSIIELMENSKNSNIPTNPTKYHRISNMQSICRAETSSSNRYFANNKDFINSTKLKNTIGYKMLLKQGWSGISGLGSNESGILVPILPKKKDDRSGLGYRITKLSNNTNILQSTKNHPNKNCLSQSKQSPSNCKIISSKQDEIDYRKSFHK